LKTLGNIKKGELIVRRNTAYGELSRVEGKDQDVTGSAAPKVVNIQRQVDPMQASYTYRLPKRAETAILLASATSDNRVVDKAHAFFPAHQAVKALVYSIAFILGLIIPAGFAFSREVLDDRIKTSRHWKEQPTFHCVGIVGVNEGDSELLSRKNPRSQDYRVLPFDPHEPPVF